MGTGLISFVGAGPGAADLITLRGAHRLATADVVVWASSLVPAAVVEHCRDGVELHDSAGLTLEDVLAVYAAHPDAAIVRLHDGDVSLYSALTEQITIGPLRRLRRPVGAGRRHRRGARRPAGDRRSWWITTASISGEHPDWAEYRDAMLKQGKSLLRVTPAPLGSGRHRRLSRPPRLTPHQSSRFRHDRHLLEFRRNRPAPARPPALPRAVSRSPNWNARRRKRSNVGNGSTKFPKRKRGKIDRKDTESGRKSGI